MLGIDAQGSGVQLTETDVPFHLAALTIDPVLRSRQFYTIINTVTSLLGSCLSTFAVSALVNNKCALSPGPPAFQPPLSDSSDWLAKVAGR